MQLSQVNKLTNSPPPSFFTPPHTSPFQENTQVCKHRLLPPKHTPVCKWVWPHLVRLPYVTGHCSNSTLTFLLLLCLLLRSFLHDPLATFTATQDAEREESEENRCATGHKLKPFM